MEISHEEGKQRFEKMKKKSKDSLTEEMNSLKISKFDKDLKEKVLRLLKNKKVILKLIGVDLATNKIKNVSKIKTINYF